MNGIETIHTAVFPVFNTPRLICSIAEVEKKRSRRTHFKHRFFFFILFLLLIFFLILAPSPPPTPFVNYILPTEWSLENATICSVEHTESSSSKATWRSCWFSTCMYFSFDLLIVHTCAVNACTSYLLSITTEALAQLHLLLQRGSVMQWWQSSHCHWEECKDFHIHGST